MRDIRQTKEYAHYLEKLGWRVEKAVDSYVFIKKIPIFGTIIKVQRPEHIRLLQINRLAELYKARHILIEPKSSEQIPFLTELGYKTSSPYLPSKTLHLTINGTLEAILASFKKDARQAIRKTSVIEAKVCGLPQINVFRYYWRKAILFKRHIPSLKNLTHLKESFGSNCLFLLTDKGDAGAIFIVSEQICYYWQAFTSNQGRERLAQYRLIWDGIIWAKQKGAKILDFEGIYDERFPDNSWKGFTHFKKSFGGKEISYPGAYSLIKHMIIPFFTFKKFNFRGSKKISV